MDMNLFYIYPWLIDYLFWVWHGYPLVCVLYRWKMRHPPGCGFLLFHPLFPAEWPHLTQMAIKVGWSPLSRKGHKGWLPTIRKTFIVFVSILEWKASSLEDMESSFISFYITAKYRKYPIQETQRGWRTIFMFINPWFMRNMLLINEFSRNVDL